MDLKKIIRSAGTVSGFTSLSRLLGLVRDVLMAGFFGTSLAMDAFVVAFTVPNLFRRLFGEGALSSAFVPVLVQTREDEGADAAWTLVNQVLSLLAVVLVAITMLVILLAGIAANMGPQAAAIFSLLQIMMPYMIFICLAAISMGILNSLHHFAVSSFAPCLLNLLWIGTLLLIVPHCGTQPEDKIRAVAWAILLAGFLQWAVQWPVLRRRGWTPLFSLPWKDPRVRQVLLLMGPAALGMAVLQLDVMIDRLLALWIGHGAPSALFFAERLIYFPLGIIATALGTVLLPVFAGHAARADHDKIREGVSDGLRLLLFVMIPAAVGLLVLAGPVVQMIFEWKEFGAASVWMTAIALQCYAPGLVVFGLAKIFVPAFYGMQDTRTPVRIGMIAVALNLILNLLFMLTLPQSIKHAGIAFATVLSSIFNMSCLALILQKRLGRIDWHRVGNTAGRSLVAAVIMGIVVGGVCGLFPAGGKLGQIVAVGISIAVGGLTYLLIGRLLKLGEIGELVRAFRR